MQQLHALRSQDTEKNAHTSKVTRRSTETVDEAHLDRMAPVMKTMGIVLVAAFAANADGRSQAKIAATSPPTSSAAREGKRS